MRNRIVKIAAWVVAGRLERAGVGDKTLQAFKRELRMYNLKRRRWTTTTEKSETEGEKNHASDKPEVRT